MLPIDLSLHFFLPTGQRSQTAAPGPLYFPAEQVPHVPSDLAPLAFENFPAVHFMQTSSVVSYHVPFPHHSVWLF